MARTIQAIDQGRPWHHRSGFTLIESMMASVVVAIALIGVSGMLASSSDQSQVTKEISNAILLAQQLMEEIAGKPLLETDGSHSLGPEASETSRILFDNVDDYHNYSDYSSAVKDSNGNWFALGDGQQYARKVTVEYRSTPTTANANGDFALVTVTVTAPGGQKAILCRLMSKTPWTL